MRDLNPNNIVSESNLHHDILDILFKHKKEISKKLSDILRTHYLDHVAINVINPNNEIIIFSTTPSVEYNLIIHGLWKYDNSFLRTSYEDGSLFWWDDGYQKNYLDTLKTIKEKNHHFTLGLYLIRKIETFHINYSFATRSKKEDLHQYYKDLKNELLQLGDYGYKLIREIYKNYCYTDKAPYILNDFKITSNSKNHLKLIIKND